MPPHPARRRSVVLLLAFVLGGIATPLAHEVVHLVEGLGVGSPAGAVATVPDAGDTSHECELCEVRLAAVATDLADRAAHAAGPLEHGSLLDLEPLGSMRAFDGRAPPSLM